MRTYEVTIRFDSEFESRYFIEAKDENEAQKEALDWAISDVEVVSIEDINEDIKYIESKSNKFKEFALVQINKDGTCYWLLKCTDAKYLVNIAEHIFIHDAKKLEVRGTNNDYKSYKVIFNKRF